MKYYKPCLLLKNLEILDSLLALSFADPEKVYSECLFIRYTFKGIIYLFILSMPATRGHYYGTLGGF